MIWLRNRLYNFGHWLARNVNIDQRVFPDDDTARWWSISLTLEGTEQEANEVMDEMIARSCGKARCGEFGQFCNRDWVGSTKVVHGLRLVLEDDAETNGGDYNTNHTAGSWNYTILATGGA